MRLSRSEFNGAEFQATESQALLLKTRSARLFHEAEGRGVFQV